MTSKSQNAPLSDLRIIDLTQFLSGPYCTQMLADLGAEVIKVESPQGDFSRSVPPNFIGDDSAYYISINRNKKSIVVDMKSADGIAVVRDLILASDIVVENFRPGVLDRLGLIEADLRQKSPGLIWCSISGFGQNGPYREKPAYDMIVQALSGGMSMTGEPGRSAVRAGIPIGDIAAGMYAATSILAAVHRRTVTGRGDAIDISMLDCQVAMLSYQAAYYLHSGHVPARQGSGHDSIPTYRGFMTGDGTEIVITANTERMWQGLCKVLSLEELPRDPRFITNIDRYKNREALWPILEHAFLQKSAAEWVPLLEAETIPVGVVNTLDRVMNDPQIVHREMVMELRAPDGRSAKVAGNPIKLSDTVQSSPAFPPRLGENSRDILRTILQMPEAEISQKIASGTVMQK